MKAIRQSDLKAERWSGGQTWTYYIAPPTATLKARDFDLRISSASVDIAQSTFSDFTGYTRYFSVLTAPVVLDINGSKQTITARDLIRFDGADRVTCSGQTRDINVFVRSGLNAEVSWQCGLIDGPILAFSDDCLYILDDAEQLTVDRALCIRLNDNL